MWRLIISCSQLFVTIINICCFLRLLNIIIVYMDDFIKNFLIQSNARNKRRLFHGLNHTEQGQVLERLISYYPQEVYNLRLIPEPGIEEKDLCSIAINNFSEDFATIQMNYVPTDIIAKYKNSEGAKT